MTNSIDMQSGVRCTSSFINEAPSNSVLYYELPVTVSCELADTITTMLSQALLRLTE